MDSDGTEKKFSVKHVLEGTLPHVIVLFFIRTMKLVNASFYYTQVLFSQVLLH